MQCQRRRNTGASESASVIPGFGKRSDSDPPGRPGGGSLSDRPRDAAWVLVLDLEAGPSVRDNDVENSFGIVGGHGRRPVADRAPGNVIRVLAHLTTPPGNKGGGAQSLRDRASRPRFHETQFFEFFFALRGIFAPQP